MRIIKRPRHPNLKAHQFKLRSHEMRHGGGLPIKNVGYGQNIVFDAITYCSFTNASTPSLIFSLQPLNIPDEPKSQTSSTIEQSYWHHQNLLFLTSPQINLRPHHTHHPPIFPITNPSLHPFHFKSHEVSCFPSCCGTHITRRCLQLCEAWRLGPQLPVADFIGLL